MITGMSAILDIISDCLAYPDLLTEWEVGFLYDLEEQLSNGIAISSKQRETLLQIKAKIEIKLK